MIISRNIPPVQRGRDRLESLNLLRTLALVMAFSLQAACLLATERVAQHFEPRARLVFGEPKDVSLKLSDAIVITGKNFKSISLVSAFSDDSDSLKTASIPQAKTPIQEESKDAGPDEKDTGSDAKDKGVDENATLLEDKSSASENDESEFDAAAEEDEVCRPVIKVLVRRRENSAVALLRKDLRDGLLDSVAIDIQVVARIKDQPNIKVPISPDRYRVWHGYHSGIRRAILRTAAEFSKCLDSSGTPPPPNRSIERGQDSSEGVQSTAEEPVVGSIREGGYPTRTSWWTVGKKHPEKEGMVKHLSGGPHKDKFDLLWLETLTREELHALHSDDHEKKVNWNYARKPSEIPASEDPSVAKPDAEIEAASAE